MAGPPNSRARRTSPRRPRQRYRPPDLQFFAQRTPRSLYWLGFLMADGCVTSKELIVVLQRRDKSHLRSLAEALGCADRPLAPANRGTAFRLSIASVQLARQLGDLGIVPGRSGATTGVADWMALSSDFWRGVVDGDGSIRFHPTQGIPSLEVVGAPGLMAQLCTFFETTLGDGLRVKPYRHSQSRRVRMVKVGGRRAKAAARILYPPSAQDALTRKRQRAVAVMAWQPQVRSRYPWERWGNGEEWIVTRDVDYDDPHRLWEAARRAARGRGLRVMFSDEGDEARIRFVPKRSRTARA